MKDENKKDNKIGIFLSGCVFTAAIVFLLVIYNNIQNSVQVCDIFYAEDLRFNGVDYDSIIAESGILKFSQNNNSRIISVDAGYSVLCYKENQ